MKLQEIRTAKENAYEGFDDKQLVEAFGTVNVYKKEFAGLESSLKGEMNARFDGHTGFAKGVREQLTFATGDLNVIAAPVDKTVYTCDIPLDELAKLLEAEGIRFSTFIDIKYSITNSALSNLKNSGSLSSGIRSHIKGTKQTSLDIKVKGV